VAQTCVFEYQSYILVLFPPTNVEVEKRVAGIHSVSTNYHSSPSGMGRTEGEVFSANYVLLTEHHYIYLFIYFLQYFKFHQYLTKS